MTGRTHLITAGLLGVMVCAKWELEPPMIAMCMIGGLAPDVDIKNSYLGRFLPLWRICRHRGFTHSLIAAVLSSCLFLFQLDAAIIFFLGYLSHLLLDMCNPTGIPLWWPHHHRVSIMGVKTGSFGELIVAFLFYIMMIALLSNW